MDNRKAQPTTATLAVCVITHYSASISMGIWSGRCFGLATNVHSAHDWLEVLEPIVAHYRGPSIPKFFRGDAAFASPDLYRFLEDEKFFYAIRLPANQKLQRKIEHLSEG